MLKTALKGAGQQDLVHVRRWQMCLSLATLLSLGVLGLRYGVLTSSHAAGAVLAGCGGASAGLGLNLRTFQPARGGALTAAAFFAASTLVQGIGDLASWVNTGVAPGLLSTMALMCAFGGVLVPFIYHHTASPKASQIH